MSLLDLQTDLKSLNWGGDRPYVTKDIENPPSSSILAQQATRRVDDTERITKMMGDTPGLKFAGNQALLLQTGLSKKIQNIKDTQGTTTGGAILRQIGGTGIKVAQIVGSTLAQVPVSGTGLRFKHGFRTDTYLQDNRPNSSFTELFGDGGVQGGPITLTGGEVPTSNILSTSIKGRDGELIGEGSVRGVTVFDEDLTYTNNYIDQLPENNIIQATSGNRITQENLGREGYRTAAESKLVDTIGDSIFSRTDDVTPKFTLAKEGSVIGLVDKRVLRGLHGEVSDTTKEPGDLGGVPNTNNGFYVPKTLKSVVGQGEVKVQDFRREGSVRGSENTSYSFDYNARDVNRETRVNLGRQGKKININPTNLYSESDPEAVDKLNELGALNSKPGLEESRDFISLNFQVITPDNTTYLYFRAYLDSFTDSYNPTWGTTQYLGRAEGMRTYEGFSRNVSLGFKIAASTRSEMKPIYEKVNYLASATAPTYGDGTFMRGTIIKVTVGDYLFEVPAVIEDLSFSWEKNYPWEISMTNPESEVDDDMQVLPHVLDCTMSLGIIHNFIPQTGKVPFVTNPDGNKRGKRVWTALPKETI